MVGSGPAKACMALFRRYARETRDLVLSYETRLPTSISDATYRERYAYAAVVLE